MLSKNTSQTRLTENALHAFFATVLIAGQLSVYFTNPNDFSIHSGIFLKLHNEGSTLPGNPAYYTLLYLSKHIFLLDANGLTKAGVCIASIAKVTLYIIVFRQLLRCNSNRLRTATISGAICLSFSIAEPIRLFVFHHYYLGTITPNLYHNPTTIISLPFALLTYISAQHNKPILQTTLLAILCASIKPSFLLSFAPSLGLIWLLGKGSIKQLVLSILMGTVIIAQFAIIYYFEVGNVEEAQSGIALSSPFYILRKMSASWYLPLALISSFAFPVWTISKRESASPASLNFLVALILTAFVIETGPRQYHGNFIWQSSIASFILFFEGGKRLLTNPHQTGTALLTAHSLSGLLYPIWMVTTSSFK